MRMPDKHASGVAMLALVAAIAASRGCSDSRAAVREASLSPASPWPNEPAGMTVVTDWGFDHVPPTAGDVAIPGSPNWSVFYGVPPSPVKGWVERSADAAAPLSPPHIYGFVYPQGMVEGLAPSTVYYPRQANGIAERLGLQSNPVLNADEIYAGFWWKPSSPFDLGPNGNKIAFLFNGGGDKGGQQFLILMPDQRLHVLPEYPGDYQWRRPNENTTLVTLGRWHRVEWYSRLSAGTLKWWLDGELQGNYSDVTNPHKFDMFQFSPTWGGNSGARKRQTDHYWFDHVRVSIR